MNGLAAADLLAAQLSLLAALQPIVIASVSTLIVSVMFGVCRLCAGCNSSDRQSSSASARAAGKPPHPRRSDQIVPVQARP